MPPLTGGRTASQCQSGGHRPAVTPREGPPSAGARQRTAPFSRLGGSPRGARLDPWISVPWWIVVLVKLRSSMRRVPGYAGCLHVKLMKHGLKQRRPQRWVSLERRCRRQDVPCALGCLGPAREVPEESASRQPAGPNEGCFAGPLPLWVPVVPLLLLLGPLPSHRHCA